MEYEEMLDRKIKMFNTCLDLVSQIQHLCSAGGMFVPNLVWNNLEQLHASLYWELAKVQKDKNVDFTNNKERSW